MGKVLFMRKGETHTVPRNGLPAGYTELVYIQSSGTQYVDTLFKPNQNTRAIVDAEFINNASSGRYILGARAAWANAMFAVYGETDGTQFTFGHGTQTGKATGNVVARHKFDLNKNSLYIDGVLGNILAANNFQSENSIYLFSCNQNGSPLNYTEYLRVYSCQIYDNGTLVRDYIPCINPSGVVGLYDTVTKAFFGNAGTGTFGAGDVVEYTLPDGYEKLVYIESTGTQYIDTQVPFSADNYNKIKLSVEMDAANAYHTYEVNGTGTSGSNCFYVGNYDGFVAYGDGKNDSIFGQVHQTGRCKYTIDAKNGIVSADGVDDVEFTPYAPSVSANICVCGFGRTSGTATGFSGKFYAAQLLVDGAYFRLYVPCVTENGDVGMYDVITRTFYGNAGTGSFIGSEVA